jgi:hypothetical protein
MFELLATKTLDIDPVILMKVEASIVEYEAAVAEINPCRFTIYAIVDWEELLIK